MTEIPKLLYTTTEAAYALACCRRTVLKLVEQGYLPARRMGRVIRIHRKDLEALAKYGLPSVWEANKPWPEQRQKRA